jgi:hypothetical protein
LRLVQPQGAGQPPEARFYSQQRYYDPTSPPLTLNGLHLATNRTFDVEEMRLL